jgi:hypothetical protein
MLAIIKPTSSNQTVPKLADVSPRYGELVAKRDQIQAEKIKLEAEQTAIYRAQHERMKLRSGSGVTLHSPAAHERRTREQAGRIAEIIGEPDNGAAVLGENERIVFINDRLADLRTALERVGEMISVEVPVASAKIREIVAPQHRKLVRDICEAMVTLHKANVAYHGFADALNAEKVWWTSLGPSQPLFVSAPTDRQSPIAKYLQRAVDDGHIPATFVPQEFR